MTAITIDLDEAPADIARMLNDVLSGGEIVVKRGQDTIARIVALKPASAPRGGFGALRGQIWMAEDFSAPLADEFRDYVE